MRNLLAYMNELSAEVKKAQAEGKCTEAGIREIKLPQYAAWGDYERGLAGNVQRYCTLSRHGKVKRNLRAPRPLNRIPFNG